MTVLGPDPDPDPAYTNLDPADVLAGVKWIFNGVEYVGTATATGSPVDSAELATLIAAQLSALSIRRLTERQPLVTDVALVRGTNWRIPLTVDPIPDDWTRIELTARRHTSDTQSQSLLHIVLTNPAGDSDGLQILSGSPAANRAAGAITVTDGQAIANVTAAAVADVADGEYCWDCKVTSAAGIDQVARGTLFVERDVTRLAAA